MEHHLINIRGEKKHSILLGLIARRKRYTKKTAFEDIIAKSILADKELVKIAHSRRIPSGCKMTKTEHNLLKQVIRENNMVRC